MEDYELVEYDIVYAGMRVKDVDTDFEEGVIIEMNDIHNIYVKFDNGGFSLYCLDKTCGEYEPVLYTKINKI